MSSPRGLERAALPLFLALFVIAMGFGVTVPIFPLWARELGATPFMLGILNAGHSSMQALFAPIWGRYSDRLGRKPILILGVCGHVGAFVAMGLAANYATLLAARIIGSIVSSAAIPTARALVADLSGPERRSQAMGFMGAAMGTGFAAGPMLGGFLAPFGLAVPLFGSAGLGLLTLVLVVFLVRDPAHAPRTRRTEHVQQSLAGNLTTALRSRSAPYYWLSFAHTFGHTTLFNVLVYLLVDRFGTSGLLTGAAFTIMGVTGAAIQGLLVGRLTRRFGDFGTIIGGLGLGIAGHLLIGNLPWLGGVYIAVVIISMSAALIQPTTLSLLSTHSPLPQGVTMGLQATFQQLGMLCGPLWAGFTYALHPALPFLSAAALLSFTTFRLLRPHGTVHAQE